MPLLAPALPKAEGTSQKGGKQSVGGLEKRLRHQAAFPEAMSSIPSTLLVAQNCL